MRRSSESQKKNTPEYERAQQRLQSVEASLVAMTNNINSDLNALESRRGVDLKNELLTVVASQVRVVSDALSCSLPMLVKLSGPFARQLFLHSRAQEHLQQLLPLFPGTAKPLMLLSEHSRGRPSGNPANATVMGVVNYTGEASGGVIDIPLDCARPSPTPTTADLASVHPIPPNQSFVVR